MSKSKRENIDYGPLACLVGTWEGQRGMDIAPDPNAAQGIERSPVTEVMTYTAAGDVENGKKQWLAVLRYHQVVTRKSTGLVFHDQVGYWTYDKQTGEISHSLTIPRAVCILAGGKATVLDDGSTEFVVSAEKGSDNWGIIEAPFMRDNASSKSFTMTLNVKGDAMNYRESTILEIYGNKQFDHRDKSQLVKVA